MSENHLIWLVILAGATASYAFRSLPLLAFSYLTPENRDAGILRFFDYATYAIIGGIVGSALLGGADLSTAVQTPQLMIGLITVIASFAFCLKVQGNLLPLFAGVSLYHVLSLLTR